MIDQSALSKPLHLYCHDINLFYFRNLVSKHESGRVVIPSLPEGSKEMAEVLLEHARPLVGEMTKENQLALFGKRPLLVAYFDVDWDKQLRKGA